jgi:two-component system chemotaxis response regulator CheB
MELGALDFVAKPAGTVSLEIDRLRPILVEKVRGAAQARIRRTLRLRERVRHQLRGATLTPLPTRRERPGPALPLTKGVAEEPGLVVIGSSTGGPVALDLVLPRLPADFPWPIVVAQHMPARFTGPFARRLDRQCALRVVEVTRPMPLQAGTIYIARGDADLVVAQRANGLCAMSMPAQRDYPWHPSVERLVASAMTHYEPHRMIGVLLTGMGRDGADAMTRLHEMGGHTIAEAESSAIVWGMPGELVKNGGASRVAPVEQIAALVVDMVEANAVR